MQFVKILFMIVEGQDIKLRHFEENVLKNGRILNEYRYGKISNDIP